MNKDITRREFVKGTVAASVAIAGGGYLPHVAIINQMGYLQLF